MHRLPAKRSPAPRRVPLSEKARHTKGSPTNGAPINAAVLVQRRQRQATCVMEQKRRFNSPKGSAAPRTGSPKYGTSATLRGILSSPSTFWTGRGSTPQITLTWNRPTAAHIPSPPVFARSNCLWRASVFRTESRPLSAPTKAGRSLRGRMVRRTNPIKSRDRSAKNAPVLSYFPQNALAIAA